MGNSLEKFLKKKEEGDYYLRTALLAEVSAKGGRGGRFHRTVGHCNYDCSGWPYAQCRMFIESQFGSASATCINPFPRGGSTKYSNYPECSQVPDGCERCDDVCAYRDGRRSRLSY